MPYIAYVPGLKGPELVKFIDKQTNGHGFAKHNISELEISTSDFNLSLTELRKKFPSPEAPSDAD